MRFKSLIGKCFRLGRLEGQVSTRRAKSQICNLFGSVDALEPRALLATITVTSLADSTAVDGEVTLREAINAANSDTSVDGSTAGFGADQIVFDAGLSGTITLNGSQLPAVTEDLMITGPAVGTLTIDGNLQSRVLEISPGVTAEVSGLTITRGNANGANAPGNTGGGIYSRNATLTLRNMALTANIARQGAGVHNDGEGGTAVLNVINSSVTDNVSNAHGGGIFSKGTNSVHTELTVVDTVFLRNRSETHSGGAIFNNGALGDAALTVLNSDFTENSSHLSGAAIFSNGFGGLSTVVVDSSTFTENHSGQHAGAIFNNGHQATRASVHISDSTFEGNTAANRGGALDNNGNNGNAIMTIDGSTISLNEAGTVGGAIMNHGSNGSASLAISNSTISGNDANAFGGGVRNDDGEVEFRNSTLTRNFADHDQVGDETGGGISSNNENVTLHNTIVVGNFVGGGSILDIDDIDGVVDAASSFNIVSEVGGGGLQEANNNQSGMNPWTVINSALRDNGGPTATHALRVRSPAIDAGSNGLAVATDGTALATDQRGSEFLRIVDGNDDGIPNVDIGAFEAPEIGEVDLVATHFDVVSDNVLLGQSDVTFTIRNAGTDEAAPFLIHFVWSPNDILGDADDVIVPGSSLYYGSRLAGGSSWSSTRSVQLDVPSLYTGSFEADKDLFFGGTSKDLSHLHLVVDVLDEVIETNELNNLGQGQGIDRDHITYFPTDSDGSGIVTPREALAAVFSINTANPKHDHDGNGVVTPLEAIRTIFHIGVHVNPEAFEAQSLSVSPEPLVAFSAFPFDSTDEDEKLFESEAAAVEAPVNTAEDDERAVDANFQGSTDWLSVI